MHLMQLVIVSAALLLSIEAADTKQDCKICNEIITEFNAGIARTAKDNFGGGNTAWEEKSLGSYTFSETRLVDITEKLCKSSSESKHCHRLVEQFEEDMEKWWFNIFKANPKNLNLYQHLCVETSKLCCPYNHFGVDCKPCPTENGLFCNEKGDCDGNGTRTGSGKCSCVNGYSGDLCTTCSDNYFNDSSSCVACHASCSGGCSGPLRTECSACKEGYVSDPTSGCLDVNECLSNPCTAENEFCLNEEGSYKCQTCNVGCQGCTGPSDKDCKECAKGFESQDGEGGSLHCTDINECSVDSPHCRGANEKCVNTPGSFQCECQSGYSRNSDGACAQPPKPKSKKKKKKDNQPKGKGKKVSRIIWTVPFTLEFLKYGGSLLALGLFANLVKGSVFPVLSASVGVGAYIAYQSVILDKTYMNPLGK